ncbi:TrmH family RNA methyltransferase [Achromobacter insolitus]|uniref:TrmH family RNA methyltransferase n=1 Tax=Achromobacter insolitus TaxID=217204 RepID=UPI0020A3F640|nr:RNA methyltransferase [Achromobacter insolitus]MCP1403702.1 TrmH family RNA methyltransferase [Achromobacter insolitus]
MKHISSRDNPAVKALAKLAGTAGKRGAPVLLDGVHLCQAWLQHHGAPDQAVFDVERLSQPDIAALAAAVPERDCLALDARLMQSLAAVESGQGVAFLVSPPAPELPDTVDENCVLFDRIQDPGNVGTLLRTCAAAGVKRVFLATGTAAAWSPKVLRSGQGAHFALAIHEHVDLPALLPRFKVPLVATALDGARNLYEGHLPERCAWVFGHEGQGVAAELLAAARLKVCIPHDMAAVESLNVGAAAAICLFEQRRQVLRGARR